MCRNLLTVPPGFRGRIVLKEDYIRQIACSLDGTQRFAEIPWSNLTVGCVVVAVLRNFSLDNAAKVITSPEQLREIESDVRQKAFYVILGKDLKASISHECAEDMEAMLKTLSAKKQSLRDFLLETDIAKGSVMPVVETNA